MEARFPMEEQRPFRSIALGLLLAALCVVGVELLYCRFLDPNLYEDLLNPVRHLYHEGRVQVKGLAEDYGTWQAEQTVLRQDLAEEQRAQAALRRRQKEEKRLLKRMARDQKAVFALLEAYRANRPEPEEPALSRVTSLSSRGGQEYLSGGGTDFYYFCQTDSQWADELFGQDPIGKYGCGPTAMAMAVSTLLGERTTPVQVADWAAGMGYAAPGSGSYYSIVRGVAEHYGLICEAVKPLTAENLTDALAAGNLVVALMGPGHFTGRGHFIVLRGLTPEGQVLVGDPNSRANSLLPWDPQVLVDELSPTRMDGAPLWKISAP